MMHGLVDFASTPRFKVAMSTFGEIPLNPRPDRPVCYGCCATAIVYEHWKELPLDCNDRYSLPDGKTIRNFESVINSARMGSFLWLASWYGIVPSPSVLHYDELRDHFDNAFPEDLRLKFQSVNMLSDDWHESLPVLCEIAKQLREMGL